MCSQDSKSCRLSKKLRVILSTEELVKKLKAIGITTYISDRKMHEFLILFAVLSCHRFTLMRLNRMEPRAIARRRIICMRLFELSTGATIVLRYQVGREDTNLVSSPV